jgi:hypothetical protein
VVKVGKGRAAREGCCSWTLCAAEREASERKSRLFTSNLCRGQTREAAHAQNALRGQIEKSSAKASFAHQRKKKEFAEKLLCGWSAALAFFRGKMKVGCHWFTRGKKVLYSSLCLAPKCRQRKKKKFAIVLFCFFDSKPRIKK